MAPREPWRQGAPRAYTYPNLQPAPLTPNPDPDSDSDPNPSPSPSPSPNPQELILLAMRAAPGERPSACVVLSHPWLVAGGEGEGVGGVGGVEDETLCRRLSVECLAAALPPL